MLKKLVISIVIILSVSIAEEAPSTTANIAAKNTTILKGIVLHIFEDYANNSTQRIAKIHLQGVDENKEYSLLEIPPNRELNPGDQILLSPAENTDAFGMGDSFENKFILIDYAYDNYFTILLLTLLIPIFIILRGKAIHYILSLLGLAGIAYIIMPLANNQPIIDSLVITGAVGLIGWGIYWLFGSRRYKLTIIASCLGAGIAAMGYALFCVLVKLHEFSILNKQLEYPLFTNDLYVNILGQLIAGLVLTYTITLFFIRVSYRKNIYENLRIAGARLLLLFGALLIGITLPTTVFYSYNHLSLFTLFNYQPFVILTTKLIFLFWSSFLSIFIYMIIFYIQHKQHFHKNMIIPSVPSKPMPLDLKTILTEERAKRYQPGKKKSKTKPHRSVKKGRL